MSTSTSTNAKANAKAASTSTSAATTTLSRLSTELVRTSTHIDGASLLAACLATQHLDLVFGVVGIPMVELAQAIQRQPIVSDGSSDGTRTLRFVSCRHEQTASYAASVCGFLNGGRPGVCLSVAGPGLIHSLAGLTNAWSNRWPLLMISANVTTPHVDRGGFQEAPLLHTVAPYVKFAHRVTDLRTLPYIVARAVREATHGQPGPVFLEFPAELITSTVERALVEPAALCAPPPRPFASPETVRDVIALLQRSERPLLLLGKGAAYARAENELRAFVDATGIPFLPMPMAKGLVPDSHPKCVAAARTQALAEADTIVVLGARFNWMLHMGAPNRFARNVRIVHVDVCAEELSRNRVADVAVQAHIAAFVQQCNEHIRQHALVFPAYAAWMTTLASHLRRNVATLERLSSTPAAPLTYYRTYALIRSCLPPNAVVVNEGANTMDIGRTMLVHELPRSRLDSGTFATMGLGVGYAMAAALVGEHERRPVVAIQGDSAFGFSAMDYETAVRYRLPITFVVFNNSGIYYGSSAEELEHAAKQPFDTPVTSLSKLSRYDLLADMFPHETEVSSGSGSRGSRGFLVQREEEIVPTLTRAMQVAAGRGGGGAHGEAGPTIVNVVLAAQQGRKQQQHSWMSVSTGEGEKANRKNKAKL